MDKIEETKDSLIGKFKKSDEGVKFAVVVAAGVVAGVAGTLAVQAYGKSVKTTHCVCKLQLVSLLWTCRE